MKKFIPIIKKKQSDEKTVLGLYGLLFGIYGIAILYILYTIK